MKGELKGSICVALEGARKIFFQGAFKVLQKGEEKDTFGVGIDGLLDSAIEDVLEDAPKNAINNLFKDAREATVTCELQTKFCKYIKLSAFVDQV